MSFFRHEKSRSQTKSVIQLIIIEINVGFLCPFLFSNLLCMPKGLFLSNHKMKQSNTMMMNRKRKSSQKLPKDRTYLHRTHRIPSCSLLLSVLVLKPAQLALQRSPSLRSPQHRWRTGEASPFSLLPPGGQQQSAPKRMLKAETTMQQQ